jgi:hypothetical protein
MIKAERYKLGLTGQMFSDWYIVDVRGNVLMDDVLERMRIWRHAEVGLMLGSLCIDATDAQVNTIIQWIQGTLQIVDAVYLHRFV